MHIFHLYIAMLRASPVRLRQTTADYRVGFGPPSLHLEFLGVSAFLPFGVLFSQLTTISRGTKENRWTELDGVF
jgi:hypothetical protein